MAGNRALFVSVLAATVVPAVLFSGLIPVYSETLADIYGISAGQLGRWLLLLLVTFGPVGVLAGWLAGRLGAVSVVAASQFMFGAGLLLFAFRPAAGPLMACAVALVLSGNMLVGISNKIAVDLMPEALRNRGTNLLHGVNAVGKLLGPLVAGVFAAGLWRYGFVSAAALALLVGLLVALSGREYRQSERAAPAVERAAAAGEVLGDPMFWLAVAGFGFIAGAEACANFSLPAFLKTLGYDDSQKGFMTAAFTGGIVAGRFAVALLVAVVEPRYLVYACGVFAGFLALAGGGHWLLTGLLLFSGGLTFSTAWPSYFAYLCRHFGRHKAYLAGASTLSNVLGVGGCFWLSGHLAVRFHPQVSVIAGAGIFAAWLLMMLVLEWFFGRRAAGAAITARVDRLLGGR